MAKSRLEVILEAKTKGFDSIRRARGDLDNLDKSAGNVKRNWQSFLPGLAAGAAALGGVAMAAKGAWSALEGGAALIATQDKFDRLAVSIGTTGDALRTELGEGVGLLMTQSEQMGLATDLMSLGLAKTSEEATRLSFVTAELGMDMNQLALTLSNKTTMRFDQMGMRVDGFKEKVAELEAAGKSADEAFKWAFIEQAEEQVELIGGRSETTAGKIDMLKNMWGETTDAFQVSFAGSVVSQLGDIEGQAYATGDAFKYAATWWGNLTGAGVGSAVSQIGRAAALSRAKDLGLDTSGFQTRTGTGVSYDDSMLFGALRGYDARMGASRGANASYSDVGNLPLGATTADLSYDPQRIMRSTAAVHQNKEAWDVHNQAQRDTIEYQRELAAELDKSTGGLGGYASAIMDADAAMQELASSSGDVFAQLRNNKDFNMAEEIFKIGDEFGWSAGEMANFGVTSGLFDQGRANELMNQTYLLQYARQLAGAGTDPSEIWGQVESLKKRMEEGDGLASEFFSGLDEKTAEVGLEVNTPYAQDQLDMFIINNSGRVIPMSIELSMSDGPVESAIVGEMENNETGNPGSPGDSEF